MFSPPSPPSLFWPPSFSSTHHSFGNNLTTYKYKEPYLLQTKILTQYMRPKLCSCCALVALLPSLPKYVAMRTTHFCDVEICNKCVVSNFTTIKFYFLAINAYLYVMRTTNFCNVKIRSKCVVSNYTLQP